MIKSEELTNPNSCMSRAKDDEMTFVLLARDPAAPTTIRNWVSLRIAMKKNTIDDPQIVEALACAAKMEADGKAQQKREYDYDHGPDGDATTPGFFFREKKG